MPGPDCIPDSAWSAAGEHGVTTLTQYSHHMFLGHPPYRGFNFSGICFPPKGNKEQDAIEVIRLAKETRPISLKNTDNKTIVGVSVRKLERKAGENTHRVQRGFVSGRNFIENVLDLDSAARIHSWHFLNQGYDPMKETKLIPVMPQL